MTEVKCDDIVPISIRGLQLREIRAHAPRLPGALDHNKIETSTLKARNCVGARRQSAEGSYSTS